MYTVGDITTQVTVIGARRIFPDSRFHLHDESFLDKDHNDDPGVDNDLHEEESNKKVESGLETSREQAEDDVLQESSAPLIENIDRQYQGSDQFNQFGDHNQFHDEQSRQRKGDDATSAAVTSIQKLFHKDVVGPVGECIDLLRGGLSELMEYFKEPRLLFRSYVTKDKHDYDLLHDKIRLKRNLLIDYSCVYRVELVPNESMTEACEEFNSLFNASPLLTQFLRQRAMKNDVHLFVTK